MAGTLFQAVWAIGLKATGFLQSILLFPFHALLQGLRQFQLFGQTNRPIPPSSPPPAPSSVSTEARNNIDYTGRDNNTTKFDHGSGPDHHSNNTAKMAHPAPPSAVASEPQQLQDSRAPTPNIVPALPRAPATKENVPSARALSSTAAVDSQLSDGISNLDLNNSKTAAPSQAVLNGISGDITTTSTSTEKRPSPSTTNGTTRNGFLPLQELPTSTGGSTATTTATTTTGGGGGGSNSSAAGNGFLPALGSREVTRSPAVILPASTTVDVEGGNGGASVQTQAKVETPEEAAERARHSRFMREALDMARLALRTNETPVGCVLVYKDRVIAKGMNATNVTRNGTRHAELMAISALLSYSPTSDTEPVKNNSSARVPLGDKTNEAQPEETSTWGDVDPSDGHLYPYGQKLHPSPRVDASVIRECTLYVTVEPCVMCASLLRQFGIKKVYFGAVNDKFGGTGGVFRIHKNSPFSMASAPASPAPQAGKGLARPAPERRPASAEPTTESQAAMGVSKGDDNSLIPLSDPDLPGDGGNVEPGFEAEGGWGRDEAVTLLRQFYVQENNRAPVPRKKEGRAARLAAMMERDGHAGGSMVDANCMSTSQENTEANTPDAQNPPAEEAAEATAEAAAVAGA